MGLKATTGEVAIPMETRVGGLYVGGPVANAGMAVTVLYAVHCLDYAGTAIGLDVSLEESTDAETWTPITGSGISPLMGIGNRVSGAMVGKNYVRVTSSATCDALGGSVTYGVTVFLLQSG